MAKSFAGFAPGPYLLEAYGNGGFRFGDLSHRGSLLMLPGGVHALAAQTAAELDAAALAPLLALPRGSVDVLLLGTGAELVPAAPALSALLREAGITVEPMPTGAAARTYNILAGERRRAAAALIAVP